MLVHLLPACPITQHKLPLFRAHGHLSRLSHIFMVQYRRREPASPTRFPSIRVQISTTGTRASCAIPVGHGPSSATGTHANSAVPLSRGINSAMGGTRFKRRPPQPWQGSLRFRRRSPRPRVAQQWRCCDGASPSFANVFTLSSFWPGGSGRFEVWVDRP